MPVIKIRRGTTQQWTASTIVLQLGELGLDTTLNKLKAGNGTAIWNNLAFLQADADITESAQDAVAAALASGTHSNITVTYSDNGNSISLATGADVVTTTSLSNTLTNATTGYVPIADVGSADGVASLDAAGKVPDSEIPTAIARLASPTFTGTVAGITKTMVGLANVDNTTDANKPVSTAGQTALDLKAPLASPTFTGTVSGITKTMVGLGSVDNTTDADKPVSTATQTALDLKSPLASPTFTGTVGGVTKSMVGLANADNTTDANKPVSTATQTALDLKLNLSEPAVDYYISNSGSGAYLVNGVSNGLITFEKGKKYRIHINASGHPFWIQTVSGAYSSGNVYSTGITNGGAQVGHILVELPQDAPDSLYYACQYHSSMAGSISVTDKDVSGPKTVSGASYTLQIIDSTKTIVTTATSGDVTITVPTNSSVNFPLGSTITLFQAAAGRIIVSPAGGVTLKSLGDFAAFKNRFSFSFITLYQYAANSWAVVGDLTA